MHWVGSKLDSQKGCQIFLCVMESTQWIYGEVTFRSIHKNSFSATSLCAAWFAVLYFILFRNNGLELQEAVTFSKYRLKTGLIIISCLELAKLTKVRGLPSPQIHLQTQLEVSDYFVSLTANAVTFFFKPLIWKILHLEVQTILSR